MDRRKLRFVVAIGLLVVGVIALIATSVEEAGATFLTVSELRGRLERVREDDRLQVVGRVIEGSIDRRPEVPRLTFRIHDPIETDQVLSVVYRRVSVPDTFKDGAETVVTGYLGADGVFEAEQLLAKCPSKYEARDAAGAMPAAATAGAS